VFLTPHHLAIAMEYAAGGDLSEYVQANKLPGVCPLRCCVPGAVWRFFEEPSAHWLP